MRLSGVLVVSVLLTARVAHALEEPAAAHPSGVPAQAEKGASEPSAVHHGADCQLCDEGASGLELSVPLWLPVVGLEGESTEDDGSTQRVHLQPELKFALVAELRVRLGPVGLRLSANGMSLGSQLVHSGTDEELGNVDLAFYLGRMALDIYTPPIRFSGGSRTELLAIWPYVGARYALIAGEGRGSNGELIFDGTTGWGEPLVGVSVFLDLRRGWLFSLGVDVGGFGIGSEISVSSYVEARYALLDWLNLRLGWTLYYIHFPSDEEATGSLFLQGPAIGLGLPLF